MRFSEQISSKVPENFLCLEYIPRRSYFPLTPKKKTPLLNSGFSSAFKGHLMLSEKLSAILLIINDKIH